MADGVECASWNRRRGAALKPGESAVRRAGLGVNGGHSVVAAASGRGIDGGGATGSFVVTASSRRGVPERSEAQRRQGHDV
jgi:hypothetical protein